MVASLSMKESTVWRSTLRARVKPLVYRFRSRLLYKVASFYVNSVDNDNDSDFYTNGEASFAQRQLPGKAVAFDVGAAKGLWTEIALAADPNVVVHCFEPTSRRIQVLKDRKFGERAILNNFALGAELGSSTIFYGASGGSNSLFPQRYSNEQYADSDVETVKVSTIDDYCRSNRIDHVDFIKMDIEGYEMAALRGAEQMLRDGRIDVVQFEYSYVFLDAGVSLMQLMKYVHEVNPTYEFHKIYPDGTRRVTTYEHTLDNFKTQNWAIIKRT
jgi:FkbM family methyltransferase